MSVVIAATVMIAVMIVTTVLVFDAGEVGSIVGVAGPLVARDRGERA